MVPAVKQTLFSNCRPQEREPEGVGQEQVLSGENLHRWSV